MSNYCPDCDWQLEIARRMVRKDHKQRWVYRERGLHGIWRISDEPIPHMDAVSVYWMPIVSAVAHTWRPAMSAHPSC